MKLKISPLLIIFILSILNGSFYSFYFINNIFADATQFDTLAKNILNGHYSLSKDTPYIPTMHREPLYPLFLSIIYKLFGYNHFFVYFFQILIFSLISIFTFILAKNIFTKRVAFLSGIIISILPTLANYSGFILSELSGCKLVGIGV